MKAVVLLAVSSTLFLQPGASPPLSPRELLNAPRPLTSAEIASVLLASRDALAGKTFRLSSVSGSGPDVMMNSAGQPARIRVSYGLVSGIVSGSGQSRQWNEEITKIVDYTGRPARPCDGSTAAAGELVIEYTHRRTTPEQQPPAWTVTARRRAEREAGMPGLIPLFEMLDGVGILASEDRQPIGDRRARGFVARYVPLNNHRTTSSPQLIGDPLPNVAGERPPEKEPMLMRTLWIDTESLLPLRWELTDDGRRLHYYDFTFEPIDLGLPADLTLTTPPDCIR